MTNPTAEIKKYLKPDTDVIFLEEAQSTNTLLKELAAKGAKEGTVLIARRQSGGKGRLGRSFFSYEGGLYISLLLRPNGSVQSALQITVCAAVATALAIEKITGINCGIKWVNDIYLNDKKVCGILTEGAINPQTQTLSFAVLGIGINISHPKEDFPEELKDIACSLYEDSAPDGLYPQLCAEIINNFFQLYKAPHDNSYLEEYRRRSILTDKEVTYIKDGENHIAKVIGIDDTAALILEENGETLKLSAGEVSVRLK